MEENKAHSVRDIFRQILDEDKNLLNSRDELSKKLEQKVPAALTRDMKPIQTALQQNIGEMFLATPSDDAEKQAAVCQQAEELLQQDGMLQNRAADVVNTFAYAMGWNDEPEAVTTEEDPGDSLQDEVLKEEAEVQLVPTSWTCACGTENTGKFCTSCGAPQNALENTPEPGQSAWTCTCGQQNTGRFCISCGTVQPGAENPGQSSAMPAMQPINPVNAYPNPPIGLQPPMYQAPPKDNKAKILLVTAIVALSAVLVFFVVRGIGSPATGASSYNSVGKTADDKKVPTVDSDLSLGGVSIDYSVDKLHEVLGNEKEQRKGDYGTTVYVYSGIQVAVKDNQVVGLTSDGTDVKTKRDIHEGSSLNDVFSAYGKDYTLSEYDGKDLYEYTFTTKDGGQGILRFAVVKSSNVVNYISARALLKENTTRPAQAPVDVQGAQNRLMSYHQAISNHNTKAAYNMLTSSMQNQMGSYNSYAEGYRMTLTSVAGNLQVLSSDANHVNLSYDLRARDRAGSRVKVQNFSGSAELVLINGTWYIDSMTAKKQGEYFE
jgi:hypothetical protein